MKYKLVIFDFDGTLADSYPWLAATITMIADKYNFRKIDEKEYDVLRGRDARSILKYLGVPLWKLPVIGKYIIGLMADDIGSIRLFDGVDRLLRSLADRGVELAVTSSNSYDNISRILGPDAASLVRYYECGVSFFGKARRLKKILAKSGAKPEEAVYIGDEIRDIQAARKVRIAFGAVSWGYNRVDSIIAHAPEMVFENIDDIAKKIE